MAEEQLGIEWSEAVVIERDDTGRLIVELPKRAAERLDCSEGDVLSYTAFAGGGVEVWSIAKSPYSSLDDLEQGSDE